MSGGGLAGEHLAATFTTTETADGGQITLSGLWTVRHVGPQDAPLRAITSSVKATPRHLQGHVVVDLSSVDGLDTAGAWLVHRTRRDLEEAGAQVELRGASHAHAELIELARERGVPPYLLFNDRTLVDLARRRPTDEEELLEVEGIGAKKAADLGQVLLEAIEA